MSVDKIPSNDDFLDKRWRLENLYKIIDKNGNEVNFKLNWAQEELYDRFWYQMLILKARQLGVTTFFAISFLDDCFWNPNLAAGIIANKKENAEDIFKKKVKYAFDRMPGWCKYVTGNDAENNRVGELTFKNGSSYRVSTGFRSGTYQRLLISEFGNICCKSPDVAKEIVTGSLNTVSRDQILVIESTAEGREGYFYDFATQAEQLSLANTKLTPMQMRFFFFPWWKEPTYIEVNNTVAISKEVQEYLDKIQANAKVKIDEEQRRWYELKQRTLHDAMKQEYPSTPSEAFESANEGLYYGQQMAKARADGRICKVPYQDHSFVHTAWDIGLDDCTAIWCFQINPGGQIQIIDYFENSDCAAKEYCNWLMDRKYRFGTHLLPHDAGNKSVQTNIAYVDHIRPLLQGNCVVLERTDVFAGIQEARSIISRCVFDESNCAKGIKHLESYRKLWDDRLGCYKNQPFHNEASHGSDAFRYLAVGLQKIVGSDKPISGQMKALHSYWGS